MEALIAVAVLAEALLDTLSFQLSALTNSQDSVRRTQAIRLVHGLSERLKAQPDAIGHATAFAPRQRRSQGGMSLLELLVGIAIGLLVVATGLGTIVLSRTMVSTVSDVSTLQQQASYAFRIMGQQIRQSGSRTLKPASAPTEYGEFDNDAALATYVPVQGKSAPGATEYTLEIVYQNSEEKSYPFLNGAAPLRPPLRNCLGENVAPSSAPVITSKLKLVDGALVCAGTGTPETIATGVADFQVRYLRSANPSSTAPSLTYVAAESLGAKPDWLQIYAVEVCIELVGTQRIDTAGATYTRCDKSQAPRDNRLRMVQRNTYFINNHVWTTAP